MPSRARSSSTPPGRVATRAPTDSYDDVVDVPAAVVCARCGAADCAGCGAGGPGEGSMSGVVSTVAWERAGVPWHTRLWSTARATTLAGEAFFERLPDGPLAPALRFALLAEGAAAACVVMLVAPLVPVLAPSWASHVVHSPAARATVGRIVFLAVPGLDVLLVAAHAAHGLALDRGAAKNGAPRLARRALRFGLYATGWDLVLSPVGFVALLVRGGPRALVRLLDVSLTLPRACTAAFLRGAYGLDGRAAERAGSVGMRAAIAVTVLGALLILAVIVVLALA